MWFHRLVFVVVWKNRNLVTSVGYYFLEQYVQPALPPPPLSKPQKTDGTTRGCPLDKGVHKAHCRVCQKIAACGAMAGKLFITSSKTCHINAAATLLHHLPQGIG